jgi:hypothetical protein
MAAGLREDPRIAEARALSVSGVIDRLGVAGLRPAGLEMTGPCPLCGGRDRFGVHLKTGVFLCRKCGIKGGDVIQLARELLGVDFLAALDWLVGAREIEVDPAERARRIERARQVEARQAQDAARYRAAAVRDAGTIWKRAVAEAEGPHVDYLRLRGLDPARIGGVPRVIRLLRDHPYRRKIGGAWRELHRGPCMVAVVQNGDGVGRAVHQTWIDLAAPKGKARIAFEGEGYPAKLVRGSKKGGAIRLVTPPGASVLVMGEGIETTLTARAVGWAPGAAFWAGVDLGNMAGKMQPGEARRPTGVPDMADPEAFVPPAWVRRLILIEDGDSDPVATRAKLESCARRAMALRPGLEAEIVPMPRGLDLNDLAAEPGGVE